jgi:sec-independent protein translocase protein TatB
MLPDIGAAELMVIAVVALIVVGPKDLPVLLRKLGQFMAKLRGMASEFRASFDEMARQSELEELRKEVAAMRRGEFGDISASSIEKPMNETFGDIEAGLRDSGGQLHPPMSYQYDQTEAPPPQEALAATPKPRRARPKTEISIAPQPPPKPRAAPRKRKPTVEPGA